MLTPYCYRPQSHVAAGALSCAETTVALNSPEELAPLIARCLAAVRGTPDPTLEADLAALDAALQEHADRKAREFVIRQKYTDGHGYFQACRSASGRYGYLDTTLDHPDLLVVDGVTARDLVRIESARAPAARFESAEVVPGPRLPENEAKQARDSWSFVDPVLQAEIEMTREKEDRQYREARERCHDHRPRRPARQDDGVDA